MTSLASARSFFLAKVEGYAPGQSSRFAPALDELIRWSDENSLTFTNHTGTHDLVKYSLPDTKMAFWAVTPRMSDGAKLTLLNDPRFPESLRGEARVELARIDGKPAALKGIPEVAFTKLIWEPYRERILDLMDRLLEAMNPTVPAPAAELEAVAT